MPVSRASTGTPIKRFTADGAYDTRPVYEVLGAVGTADIKIVIPPRRGAVPSDGAEGTWAQRNASLETIRNVGRQGWQRESGYRRQGAVENLVFRYKRTPGNSLLSRGYESQKREAMIGCNVLNQPQTNPAAGLLVKKAPDPFFYFTVEAPASATVWSFSTVLPETPMAPTTSPSAFFSGMPPGKVIRPVLECSML